MLRKTLAAAVTAGAIATSTAAQGQLQFDFGDGELKINVWPACLYDKPGARPASIRENARAAGYRRIHRIQLHKRRYNKAHRCGFYRAEAWRRGRQFALYFDADSADLINVRVIGKGRGPRVLSEDQIRNRLRRGGWQRIRNIRFRDNDRRNMYVARARRDRAVYRIWVHARTGEVTRRKQLKKLKATKAEVRNVLRQRGYRQIRNLRLRERRGDEFWIARATKKGVTYRVFADAHSAELVRRVALEKEHISPREARLAMRRAGFRKIQNLRLRERKGDELFIARARRDGQTYRVLVDATDGEIVRVRRLK